jgi:uncharacterized protein YjbI with pentapeptide repeats
VHRVLIIIDLVALFVLWGAVPNSQADVEWPAARPVVRFGVAITVMLFSWFVLHFPREPLTNWVRLDETGCRQWPFADRFALPWVDVVDDEKLAKIENMAQAKGLTSYQGERTHDLSRRNFRCGNFERADLRRVNLSGTDLRGANLFYAELEGAILVSAKLVRANLAGVRMQGAWLTWWEWRYHPETGQSRIVSGYRAELNGASLIHAQLQGAQLEMTDLTGADLRGAQLQGANLTWALLYGADLYEAQLQGANLQNARLQGADLRRAQLQGANLDESDMAGARLNEAALKLANVRHSHVWQATGTRCDDAQVTEPQLYVRRYGETKATAEEEAQSFGELVQSSGELVLLVRDREARSQRSCDQLIAGQEQIRDVWRSCETKALTRGDYEKKHAEYLIELVCTATASQEQFAYGVYSNWVGESDIDPRMHFSHVRVSDGHRRAVAHGLFRASDRNGCPAARAFSDRVKTRLQDLVR